MSPGSVSRSQPTSAIRIRDPFVVASAAERLYYLYATVYAPPVTGKPCVGVDGYSSTDLESWTGPYPVFRPPAGFWATRDFWAPEVHAWQGRYYLFASFKAEGKCRGTQIMGSDSLQGRFMPLSDGPVTPRSWECLDGTLWVEDGKPWIVFCHEWLQTADGEMCARPLTEDLSQPSAEPLTLFHASQAPWAIPLKNTGRPELEQDGRKNYVTDGPFLHRLGNGALLMLWSSFGKDGYAVGIARSRSGKIAGPWEQDPRPLFNQDGGHCMLFRTFDGRLMLALHQPNHSPRVRARFIPVRETGSRLECSDPVA